MFDRYFIDATSTWSAVSDDIWNSVRDSDAGDGLGFASGSDVAILTSDLNGALTVAFDVTALQLNASGFAQGLIVNSDVTFSITSDAVFCGNLASEEPAYSGTFACSDSVTIEAAATIGNWLPSFDFVGTGTFTDSASLSWVDALTINTAGTITLGSNLNVGTITLTAGTFALSNKTITQTGAFDGNDVTITSAGATIIGGTVANVDNSGNTVIDARGSTDGGGNTNVVFGVWESNTNLTTEHKLLLVGGI